MSGCGTCSSSGKSSVSGCKNNGSCGTNGCNKLNSFDWLIDMDLPMGEQFDIVEVRFKNGKKDFFRNVNKYTLNNGDPVIVDVPSGHHLGHVALQGELVRLQMMKKKVENDDQIRSVYQRIKRIAEQSEARIISVDIPIPGKHIHQPVVDAISFLQKSGGSILSVMGIILLSLILIKYHFMI